MCNYYEKWQNKKYSNPHDCTLKSGWYWNQTKNMNWINTHPNVPESVIAAVKDVIVNGNRSLPDYIDEYDCLSDVAYIINNGVKITNKTDLLNRSSYKKDQTIITNVYGSTYTFYCFPDDWSDAFGYINKNVTTSNTKTSNSNISIAEKAIQWMQNLANDNSHGYSQENRWGPDYDCSSAVITAWETAGVPVKTNGATYTGNMYQVFIKLGFKDVTSSVDLSTGQGLQRSDILLNHIKHVAMYCGNGKQVEASINELGKATGGKAGDQTNKEILIRNYRNYPWDVVLRYNSSSSSSTQSAASNLYKNGSIGQEVKNIQSMLQKIGYNLEADGEFGSITENAIIDFQTKYNLQIDGIVGPSTMKKLKEMSKQQPTTQKKQKGKVIVSLLNVRTGPGLEYKNITGCPILKQNEIIEILKTVKSKDNTEWHQIKIDKKFQGYVSARYIQKI